MQILLKMLNTQKPSMNTITTLVNILIKINLNYIIQQSQNLRNKMIEIQGKAKKQTLQLKQQPQNIIIQEKIVKASGQIYIKKYQRGKILGKGGFAKCYEVTNIQTKKVSAIKIVNKATLKKSKAKQKLITQIKIHKLLNHKNIVSFDHVFEDNQNVYIILELCSQHTLNQMMKKRKRISQLEVQYYLLQISEGLAYIHSSKVIHRDLKLGNLMISENMEIKIGDFGLAAKLEFSAQKRKTICGTPNYIAPQILDGKGHSFEVDIWSLGVIIYALLYGRPPFQTSDVKKTYKKIKQCQYCFNDDIPISNNAKNLISKILVIQPSKRLTIQQILNHPFMSSNKIPRSLPNSVLNTQLPRTFLEQHSFNGTNKIGGLSNSKSVERIDSDNIKQQKIINQRFLLRSAAGFTRNLLMKNTSKEGSEITVKPNILSNNFFSNTQQLHNDNNTKLKQIILEGSTIFVKKWVDYSSKYGLGYLLSNGSTGIYFNDQSKIILDHNSEKVDYYGKLDGESSKLYSFNYEQIPENRQISKKITLMQYFRKYLNGSSSQNTLVLEQKSCDPPFTYIKKWIKTDRGILFRLNNKLIQANFTDKSQLVIYSQKNIIVYTGPNHGTKYFYELGVNNIPQKSQAYSKLQHVKMMLRKIKCQKQINNSEIQIGGNVEGLIINGL